MPTETLLCVRKDQVIIRPVTRTEARRVSGVILPDVAKEPIQRGMVIAAGPACTELATGDEVLFEKHGGTMFAHDGDMLMRAEEADVLAVVDRPAGDIADTATLWLGLPAVTADRYRWRLS